MKDPSSNLRKHVIRSTVVERLAHMICTLENPHGVDVIHKYANYTPHQDAQILPRCSAPCLQIPYNMHSLLLRYAPQFLWIHAHIHN